MLKELSFCSGQQLRLEAFAWSKASGFFQFELSSFNDQLNTRLDAPELETAADFPLALCGVLKKALKAL